MFPVVTTPGIGDTEELLAKTGTGVIVRTLDDTGYEVALGELEELGRDRDALAKRCRETALERLSLDGAVTEYSGLYETLMERST